MEANSTEDDTRLARTFVWMLIPIHVIAIYRALTPRYGPFWAQVRWVFGNLAETFHTFIDTGSLLTPGGLGGAQQQWFIAQALYVGLVAIGAILLTLAAAKLLRFRKVLSERVFWLCTLGHGMISLYLIVQSYWWVRGGPGPYLWKPSLALILWSFEIIMAAAVLGWMIHRKRAAMSSVASLGLEKPR